MLGDGYLFYSVMKVLLIECCTFAGALNAAATVGRRDKDTTWGHYDCLMVRVTCQVCMSTSAWLCQALLRLHCAGGELFLSVRCLPEP